MYDHSSFSNDSVYLFVLRCEFSGCRIFWYDRICCGRIYGIHGMADCMLDLDKTMPGAGMQVLMLAAVYGAVAFLLWKLLQQHLPKDGKLNISLKEYFSAALIVIAVFAVSNLSFISDTGAFSNGYALEIGHVRTIVDLGGIAILYAHLIQCGELRVRRELEAVQMFYRISMCSTSSRGRARSDQL